MQMELAAMIWQTGPGGAGFGPLLMPVGLVAIMVFLIFSQQRRQKKWQQMLSTVKAGDRVVTSGGIVGVILKVNDSTDASANGSLIIKVAPDNIKLEVSRSSIVTVKTDDEPKA